MQSARLAISTAPVTDRECLDAWRRDPGAENLRPVVEGYAALVYSSAYRQTGRADYAEEVTRAVFLILARRARRLRKTTVLAGWLFHITTLACRKLTGKPRRTIWRSWFRRRPQIAFPPEATLWSRVAPGIDASVERLPAGQRHAVLLSSFLNRDAGSAARTLNTTERRAARRTERGLRKLLRRLRERGVPADIDALRHACAVEGCSVPVPEDLTSAILESIEVAKGKNPIGLGAASPWPPGTLSLARHTLKALAWERWRRRFLISIPAIGVLFTIIAGIAWRHDTRLISAYIISNARSEAKRMAEPVQPWPATEASAMLDASTVHNAQDLYHTTNIWLVHLQFTREQWRALEPRRIDPLPHFILPDGLILLRNPKARRSGLAGVLGYEFDWTHAEFEFGGLAVSMQLKRKWLRRRFLRKTRSEPRRISLVDLSVVHDEALA